MRHSEETKRKISLAKRGKHKVSRPEHPCPRCGSTHVINAVVSWKCGDCGRQWRKNPKKRSAWNKGLTKKTDSRIANYGKKVSLKKKNNLKYRDVVLNNINRKITISVEQFKKLYYDDKLSQKQISKRLGVVQSAVSLFMKRSNLKPRLKHSVLSNHFDSDKRREGYEKVSKKMKGNINWRFSHKFPNKEEKKLIEFFKKHNLPFKYVGDGSFKIDGKCPDFISEERKLIIEFFGEFWHKDTDETKRIEFFEEKGWKCLVVWGKETKGSRYGRYHKGDYKWEQSLYNKVIRWMAGL